MGSSGWQLPLTKIGERGTTNRALRKAILETLSAVWDRILPWGARDLALGWISAGPDSLLKVSSTDEDALEPTELTFWFYESVDWARHLAEHWLRHAFAWGRLDFERALARLGVAIVPSAWPTVVDVIADEPWYFVHDNRIGERDRTEVRWVHDGTSDVEPTTSPVSALPEDVQRVVTALDRCACPVCKHHADEVGARLVAAAGHRVERVWGSESIRAVLAPADGTLIVDSDTLDQHAWTLRRDPSGWTTIPALTDAKRYVDLLVDAGDACVAIMGHRSPKPPRVASTSADGGKTWSPLVATGLPALNAPAFFWHPHRPNVVLTAPEFGVAKKLYRSDDGGRTFGEPIEITVAGAPQILWQIVAFDRRIIVAAHRSRQSPSVLAVAEGSGDFLPLELGAFVLRGLWCSARGVLAAFGTVDAVPMLLRSHDEGRTWTACGAPGNLRHALLGTRWFVIEQDVGLHASDDEGATWARVVDGPLTFAFADGRDPTSVYVASRGLLAHVRGETLDARALPAAAWAPGPAVAKRRRRS